MENKGYNEKKSRGCNIDYSRPRRKKCERCEKEWPVAQRTCSANQGGCGSVFPKHAKQIPRIPSRPSNITIQKRLLRDKAHTLLEHHDVHSVTFLIKKSVSSNNRVTVTNDTICTPGWAESFIGKNKSLTTYGEKMVEILKEDFIQKMSGESSSNIPCGDKPETQGLNTELPKSSETDMLEAQSQQDCDMEASSETDAVLPSTFEDILEVNCNTEENPKDSPIPVSKHVLSDNNNSTSGNSNSVNPKSSAKIPSTDIIKVCSKEEIQKMDVVPVYADASSVDKFWLFFVMDKKKSHLVGQWLDKLPGTNDYVLERRDKLRYKSIMRGSSSLDSFYVLEGFQPSDEVYSVGKEVSDFLIRDVVSFYSGTD